MKRFLAFLAVIFPCLGQEAAVVLEEPAKPDFIRVLETEEALQLQTAVTSYEKDGVKIDLIGAIHIADAAYYEELNELFEDYPVLLYEMVGGENIRERLLNPAPVDAAKKKSALSFLGTAYGVSANVLDLTSQSDGIDYTAENFVHADVTLREFQELQAEKKESFLGVMARASLENAFKPQPRQPSTLKMIYGLVTENPNLLKRQLVHSLAFGGKNVEGALGETVIIKDRNEKCLEVIFQQIEKGEKNLGVFYGAAHFPAIDESLREKGFERTTQEWLTAWDIPESKPAEPEDFPENGKLHPEPALGAP